MTKPLLLDLFCGAGGASKGYRDAGFEVVGVDIHPMPRYPYPFKQYDALEYLERFVVNANPEWTRRYAAVHASPPCQRYSKMTICRPGVAKQYPDLIPPLRELLLATGLPYIIENVPRAPLRAPVMLCGSHFGLQCWWPGQGRLGLRRHRDFETNWPLASPGQCDHSLRTVPVYGHGPGGNRFHLRGPGGAQAARDAMGIQWMRRDELSESIPPAYTRYVGRALMAHLRLTGQGYSFDSEEAA